MRATTYHGLFVLSLALGLSGVAAAQDEPRVSGLTGSRTSGESRIEIGLDFAQTLGGSSFSASQTIKENAEDGTLNSSYKPGGAPGGAAHIQYNLNPRFGIRAGAQVSSRTSDGTFSGQSPHPFFFNRPRSFSGSQADLKFKETAFTLTAVLRRGSGKWLMSLEGGPAYFSVNADLADGTKLVDPYPHDSVTFGSITPTRKKVSPLGFAVGAEIGREVAPSVALVAQARYAVGSGSVDLTGGKADVKAGGAQVRVGVRFILTRRRPGA